jgi:DNA-directed RNA polymerase subunit RPC12/RpoP
MKEIKGYWKDEYNRIRCSYCNGIGVKPNKHKIRRFLTCFNCGLKMINKEVEIK